MKFFPLSINIPNLISLIRIILVPLFIYLLVTPTRSARMWALFVFFLASVSDLLDGWIARKFKQYTELGAFLDPFADKLLVISTLVAFLILDPFIPVWMVIVIVSRDVLITWMRCMAQNKGKPLRTSRFGKFKTAFQMASIVIIIMIFIERKSGVETMKLRGWDIIDVTFSNQPGKWLMVAPYWIMLGVTLLTALSGARYIMTNWDLISPFRDKNEKIEE